MSYFEVKNYDNDSNTTDIIFDDIDTVINTAGYLYQ